MSAAEPADAFVSMLSTTDSRHEVKMGKKLQGKCLRIISPESPARLHCCYAMIMVLTAAVIALSVALSLSVRKSEDISIKNAHGSCPRNWIGFGRKCFYFSEDTSNWTFSQNFCMELKAQLARFDNMEELNFLRRYKGTFDYWIGLYRESPEHPWRWMDNTEYNSSIPIRGVEDYAYLNNNGISSARIYADRRWICSKPNSYILECQIPFASS
ncbi:C-type lectin domain family 2 member D11-like isoform X2 [Microtus ochrogaster]|uniref:C-type lectin domain family 2 member D11-like isoform X2 n=1 Tax=Microtus ochrogaster TaxID=79684 RepID=A0ABM0LMU4_MICOH|nr:C-type lectin domain family 2 member D11-like isoform X2 [Microtus ochrogaster]